MDDQRLIDEFCAWMEAGCLSPGTIRVRRCTLSIFARSHHFATASSDDVQHFLASLPGGSWSRAGHLAGLRRLYRWAVLSGRLTFDPTVLVHPIHVPPGIPKPVPESVLQPALAVATGHTRLALLLGAYAGLRRAEIAALHSRDVSDTHLTITGKGGRTRRVPIHPRLRPALDFDGYAFPGRGTPHVHPETVAGLVIAAMPGYTCHQLRHRYATRLYAGCHDILVVQRLLGHANVATTQGYVATGQEEEWAAVLAVA